MEDRQSPVMKYYLVSINMSCLKHHQKTFLYIIHKWVVSTKVMKSRISKILTLLYKLCQIMQSYQVVRHLIWENIGKHRLAVLMNANNLAIIWYQLLVKVKLVTLSQCVNTIILPKNASIKRTLISVQQMKTCDSMLRKSEWGTGTLILKHWIKLQSLCLVNCVDTFQTLVLANMLRLHVIYHYLDQMLD